MNYFQNLCFTFRWSQCRRTVWLETLRMCSVMLADAPRETGSYQLSTKKIDSTSDVHFKSTHARLLRIEQDGCYILFITKISSYFCYSNQRNVLILEEKLESQIPVRGTQHYLTHSRKLNCGYKPIRAPSCSCHVLTGASRSGLPDGNQSLVDCREGGVKFQPFDRTLFKCSRVYELTCWTLRISNCVSRCNFGQ
jgi:hypothetical protein